MPGFKSRLKEWRLRLHCRRALAGVERANPILVHQMGKVGSSTVVATLESLGLSMPVVHTHALAPDHLAHAVRRQRASASPALHEHLVVSQILAPKLAAGLFPCRVITLTREPIARAISFVFEDLVKQAPDARRGPGTVDPQAVAGSLDRLLADPANGTGDPSLWFDTEVRDVFGIDVFDHPYDLSQGYCLVRCPPVELLILRMEDLDAHLPDALGELLGLQPSSVKVVRANEGGAKWYGDAMAAVRSSYRIAPSLADRVLESRYARHFYAEERDALRSKWCAVSA